MDDYSSIEDRKRFSEIAHSTVPVTAGQKEYLAAQHRDTQPTMAETNAKNTKTKRSREASKQLKNRRQGSVNTLL